MDKQGRVWAAARVRKPQTPAWCQAGSDHPSAKLFPFNQGQRGLILYDPKDQKKTTTIDTCFTWGHVNFDDKDVLWSTFGPTGVEGWFDTKVWDKTHDEKKAAGLERVRHGLQRDGEARCLHRTGSASRSGQGQADQCGVLRRRAGAGRLGLGIGSWECRVRWFVSTLDLTRPRQRWPSTTRLPWNNPKAKTQGFSPRGMDVDSKGVVWTVLSSRTVRKLRLPQQVQGPAQRPQPLLPDSIARKAGRYTTFPGSKL